MASTDVVAAVVGVGAAARWAGAVRGGVVSWAGAVSGAGVLPG
ncbi:hypothetical protein [Streptomyces sp. NPDC004788]